MIMKHSRLKLVSVLPYNGLWVRVLHHAEPFCPVRGHQQYSATRVHPDFRAEGFSLAGHWDNLHLCCHCRYFRFPCTTFWYLLLTRPALIFWHQTLNWRLLTVHGVRAYESWLPYLPFLVDDDRVGSPRFSTFWSFLYNRLLVPSLNFCILNQDLLTSYKWSSRTL